VYKYNLFILQKLNLYKVILLLFISLDLTYLVLVWNLQAIEAAYVGNYWSLSIQWLITQINYFGMIYEQFLKIISYLYFCFLKEKVINCGKYKLLGDVPKIDFMFKFPCYFIFLFKASIRSHLRWRLHWGLNHSWR
jgi:hypothetical protein